MCFHITYSLRNCLHTTLGDHIKKNERKTTQEFILHMYGKPNTHTHAHVHTDTHMGWRGEIRLPMINEDAFSTKVE